LDGIFIRFGAHWKNLAVHRSLDVAYSQNLPDLAALFSDESRTQLKSSVIKLTWKQIVEVVTPRATSTPDKTKIAPILNELFFYTRTIRGVSIPVRTVQELADRLTATLALGHPTLDLFIDTGRLHFIEIRIILMTSSSIRRSLLYGLLLQLPTLPLMLMPLLPLLPLLPLILPL